MLPVTLRDVGLFAFSARTDVTIARLSATRGARTAFETVYARWDDPWRSASPYYRYQRRKYEQVIQLLPRDRFGRALDLGCGLGLLAPMLAPRVEEFLGLDIAEGAINRARERSAHLPNVHFEQSDMLHLPKDLDGRFDLVLVLDVLYYLSPLDAELLKQLAERIADLLVPGGLCVLVNHYFFPIDSNSRLSRRIHRAFKDSPHFSLVSEHRRPFFLVSFLETSSGPALPEHHPFSKVAS